MVLRMLYQVLSIVIDISLGALAYRTGDAGPRSDQCP
jgi:hypothetical protein